MVDLHPDLAHVGALVGTWSGRGCGEYPTIDSFAYVETVTFAHVGKPFLAYAQRTHALQTDDSPGVPLHAETGYWRFPSGGRVEFAVSHPTGINEIEEGTIVVDDAGITIELAASAVSLSATAKSVTAVERWFRLTGDVLEYRVSMAAVGQPLQHHLAATLERRPGAAD